MDGESCGLCLIMVSLDVREKNIYTYIYIMHRLFFNLGNYYCLQSINTLLLDRVINYRTVSGVYGRVTENNIVTTITRQLL